MNIAEDIGMFETAMVSGAFKAPAPAALAEDMNLYHIWERTLHAITRGSAAEEVPEEVIQGPLRDESRVGIVANHYGVESEMWDSVRWLKTE